jgi:hypothetical protein
VVSSVRTGARSKGLVPAAPETGRRPGSVRGVGGKPWREAELLTAQVRTLFLMGGSLQSSGPLQYPFHGGLFVSYVCFLSVVFPGTFSLFSASHRECFFSQFYGVYGGIL